MPKISKYPEGTTLGDTDVLVAVQGGATKKITGAQIKAGMPAGHTQGTDQGLDTGGDNAVTAAQAKAGYTHSDVDHAPSDAVSLSTVKTDVDIADAISKKHASGSDNQDLSGLVPKSLYDANSILYAASDDTPVVLAIAASRIVGRKATGDIVALTGTEARAIAGNAPLVLGSDADGDMYYRASALLARLAKGSANFKMFMNAEVTAPEWASGFAISVTLRAMTADSGDVSYTGFGFKPGALLVWAAGISGIYPQASFGFYIGSTSGILYHNHARNAGTWASGSGAVVDLVQKSDGEQSASVKSLDSDGCTLSWTKVGSPDTENARIVIIGLR